MRIHKSGNYEGIDWLKALSARKPENQEVSEEEMVKSASSLGAEAAFKVPSPKEAPEEAIMRASAEIQQESRSSQARAACSTIRQKLADRQIDPVALGVADKVQWESSLDYEWVEEVAKKAAVAFQKKASMEWQDKAMNKSVNVRPNVETSLAGRVMPSAGANEETQSQRSRVPVNANSILDPERLSRLFTQPQRPEDEPMEHDRMVAAERGARKSREEEKKAEKSRAAKAASENPDPMGHGQIVRAGEKGEGEVFVQRVPKNQISMMDDIGTKTMTREEMAKKLEGLFLGKLEDNGKKIKEAAEDRRKEIQGERQKDGSRPKDRSWDSVESLKPTSTSELQERLMQIWAPKE